MEFPPSFVAMVEWYENLADNEQQLMQMELYRFLMEPHLDADPDPAHLYPKYQWHPRLWRDMVDKIAVISNAKSTFIWSQIFGIMKRIWPTEAIQGIAKELSELQ